MPSQINVNSVIPYTGVTVDINGATIKGTAQFIQINNSLSPIPSTTSVVIGPFAGQNLNSGTFGNTILGWGTGGSVSTGSDNTLIGSSSGSHVTTGGANVYIGSGAGANVNPIGGNTYIGNQAGNGVAGASNTLIGSNAGTGVGATNQNITCLGSGANPSSSSVSHEITLGNISVTTLRCAATSITALSDARDKKDVTDLRAGLDFVKSLRPVEFVWDDRREEGRHDVVDFGFIAQDLKAAQEDADMAETLQLVYESNPERLEASYGKLVPVLVQAIKDLAAKVETLENK